MLQGVGAGAAILAGTTGTVAAGPGRREGASAPDTIFDIVEGSDDFDTLEVALETAGLDAVLDADRGQYTVFGPTDEAFADLLDALDITASELLAREDLATILLYHVTRGRRYAPSVVNAPRIRMLEGGTVTVDGTTLNGGGLGGATITATDVEASNGLVHVIDGVLLP